jgi:hypothetical protein
MLYYIHALRLCLRPLRFEYLPNIHVSMSLCLHFSMFPCFHASCLCFHISTSPCLFVSMPLCLHVHVSMSMSPCPCLHVHVSMFPEFRKWKTEPTENGNFCLFATNRKRKLQTSICLLQTEMEHRSLFILFNLGWQMMNGNRRLLL